MIRLFLMWQQQQHSTRTYFPRSFTLPMLTVAYLSHIEVVYNKFAAKGYNRKSL